MTSILGISAYYHDSAAALVVDGEIVAAAQEERFTRKKHDHAFPANAIDYCLSEAGIEPDSLDYVGFYDKPLLKFDRLLETYLAYAPRGFRSFAKAMPLWLGEKLHIPGRIRKGLPGFNRRIVFPEHHESHAASAFYPSPFDEAAILTADGVGEWATASIGVGRGKHVELLRQLEFPHSLGLLYSAFTYYLGFKVNSGEYKVMGLAPYGTPRYADLILSEMMDLADDGSFWLDMSFFNYCAGLTMTSESFHRLFGGPPREPEGQLTAHHMDVAASIQRVIEIVMTRMAAAAHEITGLPNLCLAGGVALNCVANRRIWDETPFERVWIQPAAGDAGGAVGAALLIWHRLLGNERRPDERDSQRGSLLGPHIDDMDVAGFLEQNDVVYRRYTDEDDLLERVVELLVDEKVVGWVQGRMEFGPRALGSRSILADPRSADMQSVLNLKIKFRESFRPFAPSVLRERAAEYFDIPHDTDAPYMLTVADVVPERRLPTDASSTGLERLRETRSEIPAVTHLDYSARLQTVDEARHGRYHRLLERFDATTGCPVLINTSFNIRGEPIVRSPEDAFRCFMATDMDALVLGDYVLRKTDQPESADIRRDEYIAQFALD